MVRSLTFSGDWDAKYNKSLLGEYMYNIEEFDKQKTKVFKYILYKKRSENEIRTKFKKEIEENMLDDIIEYFKEAGYINDYEYIEKQVKEYMNLKTMSIKEMKYKLYSKGLDSKLIDDYISQNSEILEEYENNSYEKILAKKSNLMDEKELKMYLYKKGFKGEE